eukprot:maker-scaffold530_size145801-snap-gene-0.15 protein:Tk01202 transcript:maker-scaffold530_size145801-snap-gene-0.15-mRNA-1 annotation:"peptidyl-prolyl cis-trans isomerase fkbp14-like"
MNTLKLLLCVGAFLGLALAQDGRPPLQVDVTKTVNCEDSAKAGEGDKVTVHYGGFLMDGKKFDSSFDRQKPFTFELGVGQVIPGWDQGLVGVCPGEERHLVVPAPLAYGERGAGDVIPPGATLLFDIVVVGVEQIKSPEELRNEEEEKQREEDERQRNEELQQRQDDQKRRSCGHCSGSILLLLASPGLLLQPPSLLIVLSLLQFLIALPLILLPLFLFFLISELFRTLDLLHANDNDVEEQSSSRRNDISGASLPIGQWSRDHQVPLLSRTHAHQALVPAGNHLSHPKLEGEGFLPIETRVELFAVHEETSIVDRDLVALTSFGTVFAIDGFGDVHL